MRSVTSYQKPVASRRRSDTENRVVADVEVGAALGLEVGVAAAAGVELGEQREAALPPQRSEQTALLGEGVGEPHHRVDEAVGGLGQRVLAHEVAVLVEDVALGVGDVEPVVAHPEHGLEVLGELHLVLDADRAGVGPGLGEGQVGVVPLAGGSRSCS